MKQLRILKAPQCRHADRFVTYDMTMATNGRFSGTATCSNCSSVGTGSSSPTLIDGRESARNALMRVEAPPVVEP